MTGCSGNVYLLVVWVLIYTFTPRKRLFVSKQNADVESDSAFAFYLSSFSFLKFEIASLCEMKVLSLLVICQVGRIWERKAMRPSCADTTEGKQVLWSVAKWHVHGSSGSRIHIVPCGRIAPGGYKRALTWLKCFRLPHHPFGEGGTAFHCDLSVKWNQKCYVLNFPLV